MGASLSDCPFPSWKLDGEEYHSLDSVPEKSKLPAVHPDYKPPGFLGDDAEDKHHSSFSTTHFEGATIEETAESPISVLEEADPILLEDETVKVLSLTNDCHLVLKEGELGVERDGSNFVSLRFGLKYETVEQFTGNSNKTHSETQTEVLKGTDLINAIAIVKNNIIENNIISEDLTDLVASFPSIENRKGISCLFFQSENCNEVGSSALTVITEKYLIIFGETINILSRSQTYVTSTTI